MFGHEDFDNWHYEAQCNQSSDNHNFLDGASDHHDASDHCPANHYDPAATNNNSAAAEHDSSNIRGHRMLTDDRLRQLLSGRRVLFERRPRPQWHHRHGRGHRLSGQQRVALGTSVTPGLPSPGP
jgi:hypothetical protein